MNLLCRLKLKTQNCCFAVQTCPFFAELTWPRHERRSLVMLVMLVVVVPSLLLWLVTSHFYLTPERIKLLTCQHNFGVPPHCSIEQIDGTRFFSPQEIFSKNKIRLVVGSSSLYVYLPSCLSKQPRLLLIPLPLRGVMLAFDNGHAVH